MTIQWSSSIGHLPLLKNSTVFSVCAGGCAEEIGQWQVPPADVHLFIPAVKVRSGDRPLQSDRRRVALVFVKWMFTETRRYHRCKS